MKLGQNDFQEIKSWIHRNGRQIENELWRYHFEEGVREDALTTLSFYQNEDGGFGRALEADSWNPNSSPYTNSSAISILKDLDFTEMQHPMLRGTMKFLESGVHCIENGWLFSIPYN